MEAEAEAEAEEEEAEAEAEQEAGAEKETKDQQAAPKALPHRPGRGHPAHGVVVGVKAG